MNRYSKLLLSQAPIKQKLSTRAMARVALNQRFQTRVTEEAKVYAGVMDSVALAALERSYEKLCRERSVLIKEQPSRRETLSNTNRYHQKAGTYSLHGGRMPQAASAAITLPEVSPHE